MMISVDFSFLRLRLLHSFVSVARSSGLSLSLSLLRLLYVSLCRQCQYKAAWTAQTEISYKWNVCIYIATNASVHDMPAIIGSMRMTCHRTNDSELEWPNQQIYRNRNLNAMTLHGNTPVSGSLSYWMKPEHLTYLCVRHKHANAKWYYAHGRWHTFLHLPFCFTIIFMILTFR